MYRNLGLNKVGILIQLRINCSVYCVGINDYLGGKILLPQIQNEFYLAQRTNSKTKTTIKVLEENKGKCVGGYIMLANMIFFFVDHLGKTKTQNHKERSDKFDHCQS